MQNKFSPDFYWGAATSAHQVEGGNHNDWTEWEKENAKRKAQSAKQKTWPDYILTRYPNPLQIANYISGRACDHYNRFREDFDIAKSLGHNAHRFSIEWSRIEPEEGKFNEKEIEHYREVIRALRERGMEPFVTLWHWTLPVWVAEQTGWRSEKTIFYFSRFCERVASEFKNEVKFWMILNEAGSWTADAYLFGERPPGERNIFAAVRVYFNLVRAHKEVYAKLKKVNPDFAVGVATSIELLGPWMSSPFIHYLRNFFFRDRIRSHLDFIGVNYYQRKNVLGRPRGKVSDRGWEIYPRGLYDVLMALWHRYRKPLFISENGLADARDALRAEFIGDHILWMKKAMADGADVRGYFHWSLLDNFEWERGFWPRFGLVEVNYRTMERHIRPSALIYKEIIEKLNRVYR